jgi:hypothetical protein
MGRPGRARSGSRVLALCREKSASPGPDFVREFRQSGAPFVFREVAAPDRFETVLHAPPDTVVLLHAPQRVSHYRDIHLIHRFLLVQ